MKYLIDTHIFLWLLFEPKKLSKDKLKLLEDPTNKIYVSSISFWEISLKYNLGKLSLNGVTPDELPKHTKDMGLEILNINEDIFSSFYKLEKIEKHKDPFDRIIIWYAINNDVILVSEDGKFSEYEKFGLKVV